ncbi:MAG: Tetratricopeptide 2 repeat protein [Myxococcales bacterium]|nr:Tetratricopeptide 2 repeat protein [Myxococcales bacterium]
MGRSRLFVNFFGVFALFSGAARAWAHALPDAPAPPRASFTVVPFANADGPRTLDFLQAGLPVFVAERLARHPGLRFVGVETIVERTRLDDALARAAATGTRFVVAGRYEKRPNWKIAVTVEVYAGAAPAKRLGEGRVEGTKDEVARSALLAAVAAFESAGVVASPEARARIVEPFGRDGYAFVLYGRGVALYTGLDQPWNPTTGRAAGPVRRRGAAAGATSVSGERALVPLGKSLVIDPRVPETRHFVGLVHLGAGNPGHARAMWSYAVDLRPDYTAAVLGLARLDRTQGLPEARERYARVLELDPDDLDARRTYGEILSEAGQLDEAQAQLERVVAANTLDLRARRMLALVLAARHAGHELAAELAEIVRLDPDDMDARLDLAAAYTSVGNVGAALEAYEEVLRRRPKSPVALKAAADLYRTKGDPAKAAATYERLRRVSPDDPRPLFLLGTSYYEAGRLDAAERMFTEGARFPGMLGDAYSNLGAIAYRRGNLKEALWFLSRAAQRRPGKAGVRYNYGLALLAAQHFDDARKEADAAAVAAPADAEVRFLGGVVALRMGRLTDAEAAFAETLRLDPAHADARHNLALLASLHPAESATSFSLH